MNTRDGQENLAVEEMSTVGALPLAARYALVDAAASCLRCRVTYHTESSAYD